jgi:hypothetical protein
LLSLPYHRSQRAECGVIHDLWPPRSPYQSPDHSSLITLYHYHHHRTHRSILLHRAHPPPTIIHRIVSYPPQRRRRMYAICTPFERASASPCRSRRDQHEHRSATHPLPLRPAGRSHPLSCHFNTLALASPHPPYPGHTLQSATPLIQSSLAPCPTILSVAAAAAAATTTPSDYTPTLHTSFLHPSIRGIITHVGRCRTAGRRASWYVGFLVRLRASASASRLKGIGG